MTTKTAAAVPRKRSRAERKAARRAEWQKHPVTLGIVPVVEYTPPGHYGAIPVQFSGRTAFNPSIQTV